MKCCPECGIEKSDDAFKKQRKQRSCGFELRRVCNKCTRRAHYVRHREKLIAKQTERNKKYVQIPYAERYSEQERKKRAKQKRLDRIMAKPWVKRPPKHDAHVKAWMAWNTERELEARAAPEELHDAHVRLWKSDRARIERWKIEYKPGHRLNCRMRVAIRKALLGQKAGRQWEQIVGYGLQELRSHFERMLPRGKTVDGALKDGWHIDHIVPKSAFDLSDERELAKAWCMSNLRLIPAQENLSKNAKRLFLL